MQSLLSSFQIEREPRFFFFAYSKGIISSHARELLISKCNLKDTFSQRLKKNKKFSFSILSCCGILFLGGINETWNHKTLLRPNKLKKKKNGWFLLYLCIDVVFCDESYLQCKKLVYICSRNSTLMPDNFVDTLCGTLWSC